VRAAILEELRREGPFHVGVLLDNVAEYLFLLGGAALAGATIVGINPTRRGEELATDIRHSDCQFIVTEQAHAATIAGLDIGLTDGRVMFVESESYRGGVAKHRDVPRPGASPACWSRVPRSRAVV